MSKRRAILGIIIVAAVFMITFLVLSRYGVLELFNDADDFRDFILDLGWIGPLAFVGLQFVQVVIFPIPGSIPQIAGGYLYGVLGGTFLSLAGIMSGSMVNFLLARRLGRKFVAAIVSEERMKRFESTLSSEKAPAVFFIMFLLPNFPKDALCYIAGLSSLTLAGFMAVSAAGRLPMMIASTLMGTAMADQNWILLIVVTVFIIIFGLFTYIFRDTIRDGIQKKTAKKDN